MTVVPDNLSVHVVRHTVLSPHIYVKQHVPHATATFTGYKLLIENIIFLFISTCHETFLLLLAQVQLLLIGARF